MLDIIEHYKALFQSFLAIDTVLILPFVKGGLRMLAQSWKTSIFFVVKEASNCNYKKAQLATNGHNFLGSFN